MAGGKGSEPFASRGLDRRLVELSSSATIMTRTSRLARDLRARVAATKAAEGVHVAETPEILSLDEWVEKTWEATAPAELLLAPALEIELWRQVIAADAGLASAMEDSRALALVDMVALARSAAEAWKRIHEWSEPPWQRMILTAECAAFARWAAAFRQRLREHCWVSRAELADLAAGATARTTCAAVRTAGVGATRVVLAGFERIEPQTNRLLEALAGAGVDVAMIEPGRERARVVVRCYDNACEEVRAAARQIRSSIETAGNGRIGVVVADFPAYRRLIERLFTMELDPPSVLPAAGKRRPRAFDLAGAPALDEHAVTRYALDVLALEPHGNPFALVSRLLLAPYPRPGRGEEAAAEQELEARARVECRLRQRNCLEVSLAGETGLVGLLRQAGASGLADGLERVAAEATGEPPADTAAGWAERFARRLRLLGWPSAGLEHDSDEGVAYNRWREVLAELSLLGLVADSLARDETLERLVALCRDTVAQAPSAGLEVQVMGVLDSAGLSFDRVYALGFTASAFPAPTRPHPLLPAAWQREQAMPFACPETELAFAGKVWERLLESTPELIASWPRLGEAEEELTASSFLGAQPAETPPPSTAPWYEADEASRRKAIEPAAPEQVPPALLRSGTSSLVVAQSRCPFMAFASCRLKAAALHDPEPEPTAATLGRLVHATLASLWREITTGERLGDLDEKRLHELARSHAAAVVDNAPARGWGLREPLVEWLGELAGNWLCREREQRAEGWTVRCQEEEFSLELGIHDGKPAVSLPKLRVDRIDELAGGARIVIDYKTGRLDSLDRAWTGRRPSDPQLPLYALALEQAGLPVAGIAFGRLAARDDLVLLGWADAAVGDKVQAAGADDFGDELARWRESLAALAEAYAGGDARVDPLAGTSLPCKACRRQSLCRNFALVAGGPETAVARKRA